MRHIFRILLVACSLMLSACVDRPDPVIIKADPPDRIECAELAFSSLMSLYYDEDRGIFYSTNFNASDLNYWWQAHALDAIVDAGIRLADDSRIDLISSFYAGIKRENHGFINDFYDDMCWMALSLIRAYDVTKEEIYLNTAIQLWDNIAEGWNDSHGGGIAWNKQMPYYKNTPANAPMAILSFRLFQKSGEKKYLLKGKEIMNWLQSTLVNEYTGLIWDGIGREGGDVIDKDWKFSYNQGTYIGAAIELYELEGDTTWLNRAIQTADNALYQFTGMNDVLVDEGVGDGGLFKGIFVRYLKMLAESDGVSDGKRNRYTDFIKHNADSLWDSGRSFSFPYLFNSNWSKAPAGSIDLSVQLSGVFLFEAAAGL